jgi:transposase InsO family protein
VRHGSAYEAVKTLSEERSLPVWKLCQLLQLTRSAYYHWLKQPKSHHEQENESIAEQVKKIHEAHPDMGYRRIADELNKRHGFHVNDKRVLRICRALHIQSSIKFRRHGCTRRAASPEHIAKNYLARRFHAKAPNEKWLTDVTEFKYYVGLEVHKLYLSAILDIYDRRIVAFVISDRNDNKLVFDTFDAAVAAEPDAHPLFHSDRGFQYTSAVFHQKLKMAGMKQSMSRVAHCLDNAPIEGFWGILKRESYYRRRFTDRAQLVSMITDYIDFYNHRRLQRCLSIMAPMEFHQHFALVA